MLTITRTDHKIVVEIFTMVITIFSIWNLIQIFIHMKLAKKNTNSSWYNEFLTVVRLKEEQNI